MKFRVFRFKKVDSTNNSAIKVIKNSNINYGMPANENKIINNDKDNKG